MWIPWEKNQSLILFSASKNICHVVGVQYIPQKMTLTMHQPKMPLSYCPPQIPLTTHHTHPSPKSLPPYENSNPLPSYKQILQLIFELLNKTTECINSNLGRNTFDGN
jgi:hypothetical protein